jgi:hypothetical protein
MAKPACSMTIKVLIGVQSVFNFSKFKLIA